MGNTKAKKRLLTLFFVLAAFSVMLLSVFAYSKYLSRNFQEEIISTMDEISGISVNALEQSIENEMYNLKNIADLLSTHCGERSFESMVEHLKTLQIEGRFMRFGVIDPNGKAYTTDDKTLYLGDRGFFKQAAEGKAALSDTLIDRISGLPINVYSAPIYGRNHETTGVLFGTKDNSAYRKDLEVKSFNGDGYSYLVRKNGETVVASSHETSFQKMVNVFWSMAETKEDNTACIETLKKNMEAGRTGYIVFNNKVEKYMYYRPLTVNDWYLLTVVPIYVTNKKRDSVMKATYILCGGITFLFAGLLGCVFYTQRKGRKKLEQILYIDPVTQGDSFEKFKKMAKPRLLNNPKCKYAMIDMDVDKFKFINDSFGYEEGNQVICFIWNLLKRFSRPEDLLAHKSADSFIALVQYDSLEKLEKNMQDFCGEVNQKQKETDKQYEIVPSVGIYVIGDLEKSLSAMMDRAAIARQSIKGKYHVWYAFYDDALRQRLSREKLMADRMTSAMKNEEFYVDYQPQYDAQTGIPTGAEALVRWKDSQRVLMPLEFIPVFESNGLITELDKYVFEHVCSKMKEWLEKGIHVVPVSVNLSRLHLYNKNFVEEYVAIREKYQLSKELIHLELTESAVFEQETHMVEVVEQLHDNGFRISMDDFGTGYSSLHMLKKIALDVLKLDKKFVDDIGDSRSEHVIESIIKLAHSLGMTVTAEGVESKEQYEFLNSTGCDEIQGFYFSRPLEEMAYQSILLGISIESGADL